MTREEWRRVKHITASALERPEGTRAAYVADACAGDELLAQEVHSLVLAAVSASALFEPPRVRRRVGLALTVPPNNG